jgi:hypothetical protein
LRKLLSSQFDVERDWEKLTAAIAEALKAA